MPGGGGAAQGTAWEPETELHVARGDFLLQVQAGCEVAVGSESGPAAFPPCRPPTAWGGKSKFASWLPGSSTHWLACHSSPVLPHFPTEAAILSPRVPAQ